MKDSTASSAAALAAGLWLRWFGASRDAAGGRPDACPARLAGGRRQWPAGAWLVCLGTAACSPSVADLAAALRHGPTPARVAAARGLGERGPAAAPALAELVAALGEPQVAEIAVWAIGEIGPAAGVAVDALLALPVAGRPLLHAAVCLALGAIGRDDPVVRRALQEAARADVPLVRQAARGAERRLAEPRR